MKIGIDARICDEGGYYADYVCALVEAFCELRKDDEIIVYRDRKALISGRLSRMNNVVQKNISVKRDALLSDRSTKAIFEKEKFAFMLFFDHHVPKGLGVEYYVVIESLKEIFFPKKKWLYRKIYRHKLIRAINHSKKVFVLDGGTALELNEQLNISEDKIEKVPGFFPNIEISSEPEISMDIKLKHNIRGEYLIYDSGNEIHNNFERILRTLKKLKDSGNVISLIILCDATTKDIDIRSTALELGIAEQILFLGSVSSDIESSYYTQSRGVIFSSIYESFPFQFSKALHYKSPIFANDIPANKELMSEDIYYLDPLSIHNIMDTILGALRDSGNTKDYSRINTEYTPKLSAGRLSEIVS